VLGYNSIIQKGYPSTSIDGDINFNNVTGNFNFNNKKGKRKRSLCADLSVHIKIGKCNEKNI